MRTRNILSAIVALTCAAPVHAQTPTPADEAAQMTWVQKRAGMVRDLYGLDDVGIKKLLAWMEEQLPSQRQFQMDNNATIRSLNGAIRQLPRENEMDEAMKVKLHARFEDELYRWIYSKAPLGFNGILRMIEKDMKPDDVTIAHKKIMARFAERMAPGATTIQLSEVDRIIGEPSELPGVNPAMPQLPPMDANPTQPHSVPTVLQNNTKPQTMNPPPVVQTPPTMVQPPRPVEPAPPMDEWTAKVDEVAKKFNFSPEQKIKAGHIFDQAKKLAQAHLDENKASYAQAEQASDASEKTGKLKELNHRMDVVYDQLMSRIESLASVEQQSGGEAPKPDVSSSMPNPASPH